MVYRELLLQHWKPTKEQIKGIVRGNAAGGTSWSQSGFSGSRIDGGNQVIVCEAQEMLIT
jgi:hypothetical protein